MRHRDDQDYDPEPDDDTPRRSMRKRKSKNMSEEEDEDDLPLITTHHRETKRGVSKKRRIEVPFQEDLKSMCRQVLTNVMNHQFAFPFNAPVDPVTLNIPDYFEKIKHPMDFSTIQKKFDGGFYKNADDFARDVRLIFKNCKTYNQQDSEIVFMCNTVSAVFEKEFRNVKAHEAKYVDTEEISNMKSIVEDLRNEHAKLLAELKKLVKETAKQEGGGGPQSPQAHIAAVSKKKKIKKQSPAKVQKPVPFDQKQVELLSSKINALSPENIQKMLSIFYPQLLTEQKQEELEIDLEGMDESTLRKLDDFVNNCLKQQTEKEEHRTISEDADSNVSAANGHGLPQSSNGTTTHTNGLVATNGHVPTNGIVPANGIVTTNGHVPTNGLVPTNGKDSDKEDSDSSSDSSSDSDQNGQE